MISPDDGLTDFLYRAMPFMALIGVEAVSATPQEVHLQVAWHTTRSNRGGLLHGGLMLGLADGAGAWCAALNLPEGTRTATIESKTNFLRSIRSGVVQAISRPLHVGRTVIVVDTEVRDDAQNLAARCTQTQAVLSKS
jgi:1,4-dihydroxy-2-naphthoyl-CoA hydrolase